MGIDVPGMGSGASVVAPTLEVPVAIANVQRRISLEREIRRGIGRASLAQLEILAATLRDFNVTSSEIPSAEDDDIMSGVHFEGGFYG